MKIEAGKKYVTRDGIVVGPLTRRRGQDSHAYPFEDVHAILGKGTATWWGANGEYFVGDPVAHTSDLVAEYQEPVTMPDSHYEYVPGPLDIEHNEHLATLARAQAYAEELVEDDYLWTDASVDYLRLKLSRLMTLLGAEAK